MDKNTNITKNKAKYNNYWTKRAENTYLEGEKSALEVAKGLQLNYKRCIKEIENKINIFYGKYASENGMTLEEAKRYLDKGELKDFKAQIKDMLAMGKKENFNEAQLNEFKRLYNKAKITRLEELEANIKYEVEKLTNLTEEEVGDLLADSYEEGYYKTIFNSQQFAGFSSSFSALNNKAIERAISTKYLGANYSSRIWQNEKNLMNTLEQEIPRGLTLGYNPRKLAKLTSDKLGTNYNNTVRLIRTEYGKILNDSTMAGYKASGIDRYQVLSALDSRTCDDCGELDNKIFKVSEGEVGINLPPFHPNCRCTTVPYFEPDEYDDLAEEAVNTKTNKKVPLNITYQEWKDSLVTKANMKEEYINKEPLVTTGKILSNENLNIAFKNDLMNIYERNRIELGTTNTPLANIKDTNGKFSPFIVDFGNMDNKLANAWANQFKELANRFYTTCTSVTQTKIYDGSLYRGDVYNRTELNYYSNNSNILINNNLTDYNKLMDRMDKLIEGGHNVKISKKDYDKYFATHEFAHTICYVNRDNYKTYVGENVNNAKAFNKGIKDLFKTYKQELADLQEKARQLDIKFVTEPENYTEADTKLRRELKDKSDNLFISKYAKENEEEFMAEAFTDYILGTNKSPYSIKVGELIDKYYGRSL